MSAGDAAVVIEPWLREILRCPRCRAELRDDTGPQGPELVCVGATCGLAYRVEDGIPVLLVDEARQPPAPPAGPGSGSGSADPSEQ